MQVALKYQYKQRLGDHTDNNNNNNNNNNGLLSNASTQCGHPFANELSYCIKVKNMNIKVYKLQDESLIDR